MVHPWPSCATVCCESTCLCCDRTFFTLVISLVFLFKFVNVNTDNNQTYQLKAKFLKAGGISSGNDVKMRGVKIGVVSNVYLDKDTASRLIPRFNYCFKSGEKQGYPSILSENIIDPYKEFIISGPGGEISFIPFLQHHGSIFSLGFKYNNIAYSSDVVDFPNKSLNYISKTINKK